MRLNPMTSIEQRINSPELARLRALLERIQGPAAMEMEVGFVDADADHVFARAVLSRDDGAFAWYTQTFPVDVLRRIDERALLSFVVELMERVAVEWVDQHVRLDGERLPEAIR